MLRYRCFMLGYLLSKRSAAPVLSHPPSSRLVVLNKNWFPRQTDKAFEFKRKYLVRLKDRSAFTCKRWRSVTIFFRRPAFDAAPHVPKMKHGICPLPRPGHTLTRQFLLRSIFGATPKRYSTRSLHVYSFLTLERGQELSDIKACIGRSASVSWDGICLTASLATCNQLQGTSTSLLDYLISI